MAGHFNVIQGAKHMIERSITITDESGDIVFEIDFQETPQAYRVKRVAKLKAQYPVDKYKYSTGSEAY